MPNSFPPGLIDHLVEIGRSEAFEELESIGKVFPNAKHGGFMRCGHEPWNQVAEGLSEEKLIWLIKALTVLDCPPFYGGSASPVIRLFQRLPKANVSSELITWILSHTKNTYLPFGHDNGGAKSFDEYNHLIAQSALRRDMRIMDEELRQRDAKIRIAADASLNLFGAIRRKDAKAIAALLNRGADRNAMNESGQTTLQYAESIGLSYLFDAAAHGMRVEYFENHFKRQDDLEDWPAEFAIITAFATTGETWPDARNFAADKELESELRILKKWIKRVTGYSPKSGHAEPGWAVEISWEQACDIGQRYKQDAIYLIRDDTMYISYCDIRRALVLVGSFRARVHIVDTDGRSKGQLSHANTDRAGHKG